MQWNVWKFFTDTIVFNKEENGKIKGKTTSSGQPFLLTESKSGKLPVRPNQEFAYHKIANFIP